MKKILAILAILAFSQAQASQPVVYGIGVETTYIEGVQFNKCERFRVGAMTNGWTLSTTYVPFNNECEGIKNGYKFKSDQKSITLGRMLYQSCGGRFCKQAGFSVSDVRDKPLNDHFTQWHVVVSVLDTRTGLAVFNSLGKKDGEWTGTVGVYYTFGAK